MRLRNVYPSIVANLSVPIEEFPFPSRIRIRNHPDFLSLFREQDVDQSLIESNSTTIIIIIINASKKYKYNATRKRGKGKSRFTSKHPSETNGSDVKGKTEDGRWRIHKISRTRNPRRGRKQRVQTCRNRRRIADASRMHRKRPIWRAFRRSNPRSQGLGDRQRRVVRGRSEAEGGVPDKFLERFRQLEEALDVRKAAWKDRWACLPVRSCLNFKVRR